jgi:Cu(I)/Ag(I) efflux system protein CusF
MAPEKMSEVDGNAASHTTRGTITAIDDKSITLAHEAVPALNWPPMTMGFAVPEGGLPKDLKIGDRVEFTFAEGEGGYRIESITKLESMEAHKERTP